MNNNELPPNKFGSQTGTLDPSSTGFDRMDAGMQTEAMRRQTMASMQQYPGIQNAMSASVPAAMAALPLTMQQQQQQQSRERETARKIKLYSKCCEKAAEGLATMLRRDVPATAEGVVNAGAEVIRRRGTPEEIMWAVFYVAKAAHSCAEKETAEEELAAE